MLSREGDTVKSDYLYLSTWHNDESEGLTFVHNVKMTVALGPVGTPMKCDTHRLGIQSLRIEYQIALGLKISFALEPMAPKLALWVLKGLKIDIS